jgi:phenylacetate-coenzyme A ligase PaaK-like adenylate-forming protein
MDLSYQRKRLADATGSLRHARAHAPRDRWPRERISAFQQQRLDALVGHAAAHSPFYREAVARLGSGPVDLAALPIVDKTTQMERFDDIVCDRRLRRDALLEHIDALDHDAFYLGRYRVMTSSGSSGRKALFVYDRDGWRGIGEMFFRHCAMTGKLPRLPRRRLVFIGGGAPTHMTRRGGATVGTLYKMCGLGVTMPLPRLVDALNAFQPELMIVYPSVGALLAEEQLRGRLRIALTSITTTSELCTPQMAERIVEAFGVRLDQVYGTTEGAWGSTCERAGALHLFEDLSIVENVDDAGHPVPEGERGSRLLVTNLFNRVHPMIRFELSDLVTLDSEPCACGRTTRRVTTLDGRADDVLYLAGHNGRVPVHPLQFDVVTADRAVREFQVIQEGERLRLRVALREDAAPAEAVHRLRERVADRLTRLGVRETVVAVEPCERIERVAGGKLQMVVADRGATNGRAAA